MSLLQIQKGASSHSAYDLRSTFGDHEMTVRHTLAVDR